MNMTNVVTHVTDTKDQKQLEPFQRQLDDTTQHLKRTVVYSIKFNKDNTRVMEVIVSFRDVVKRYGQH